MGFLGNFLSGVGMGAGMGAGMNASNRVIDHFLNRGKTPQDDQTVNDGVNDMGAAGTAGAVGSAGGEVVQPQVMPPNYMGQPPQAQMMPYQGYPMQMQMGQMVPMQGYAPQMMPYQSAMGAMGLPQQASVGYGFVPRGISRPDAVGYLQGMLGIQHSSVEYIEDFPQEFIHVCPYMTAIENPICHIAAGWLDVVNTASARSDGLQYRIVFYFCQRCGELVISLPSISASGE